MTENEFNQLISTYGANEDRWPPEQQKDARSYIASHPKAAQSLLASEYRLDARLDQARLSPGTDLLRARIMQDMEQSVREQESLTPPAQAKRAYGLRSVAALVLAAFTLGFGGASLLGSQLPLSTAAETGEMAALGSANLDNWQEAAADFGVGDIYDWVGGE